jgi:hypothetical protein
MTNNERGGRKRDSRPKKAKPENIPDIMARNALPRIVSAQHDWRNRSRVVVRGASAVCVGSLDFFFPSVDGAIENGTEIGEAPDSRVAHIYPHGVHAHPPFSIAIRR